MKREEDHYVVKIKKSQKRNSGMNTLAVNYEMKGDNVSVSSAKSGNKSKSKFIIKSQSKKDKLINELINERKIPEPSQDPVMIISSVKKTTQEVKKVAPLPRKISQTPIIEHTKAPLPTRNISQTPEAKLAKLPVQKDFNIGQDENKAYFEDNQIPTVLDGSQPNLTTVSEALSREIIQTQPT
jgi:hypothetical protein